MVRTYIDMEHGLIYQGAILMLLGMGTVFVFLTALVIAMTIMASLVSRMQPAMPDKGVTDEEVAAIGAAIRRFRQQ